MPCLSIQKARQLISTTASLSNSLIVSATPRGHHRQVCNTLKQVGVAPRRSSRETAVPARGFCAVISNHAVAYSRLPDPEPGMCSPKHTGSPVALASYSIELDAPSEMAPLPIARSVETLRHRPDHQSSS